MAVILTRCSDRLVFVHQSDTCHETKPKQAWIPYDSTMAEATRFEVHPLNAEQMSQALADGDQAATAKVCKAGLVSIDGKPDTGDTLPTGWQSAVAMLIIEVSQGPLADLASLSAETVDA
jgi:hypothetical protein